MITKREILENKTVSELEEFAEYMKLSNYSGLKKEELIDLIDKNCSEKEIKEYFGINSDGSNKTENRIRSHPWLLTGIVVCVAAVAIGFTLGHYGIGKNIDNQPDFKKYTNKKFGFSVVFTGEWGVSNEEISLNPASPLRYILLLRDQEENIVSITLFDKGENTLETIKSKKISELEQKQTENIIEIVEGLSIDNYPALAISTRADYKTGSLFRRKVTYTIRDNIIYKFTLSVRKSKYSGLHKKFQQMMDNFDFIQTSDDFQ